MAGTGGNKKTSSKLQKEHYKQYKVENRAATNKINKLERPCRKFPKDETAASNLARIKKKGYNCRKTPIVPGSNPTTPKVKFIPIGYELPKTAGEQLSELLGVPIPKQRRKAPIKPVVKHKPRKK
jgi:hypothetical protein